jgi:uncharacterized protein DUF5334
MKYLVVFLLVLSSTFAYGWDGYDYENGTHVEIDEGNLVRKGEEIEFYDYKNGEYQYGEVQEIQSSGSGAEVEVYDYESGEYRTFEMD